MSGLTPKHVYLVNGRAHVPAVKLYVEKLGDQTVVRMRNESGGLFMVIDVDSARSIAAELNKLASDAEANAATLAEEAMNKLMGKG